MIGQSIGHYEITAKLGQGGMGEVYRARDTRLNRDVALKLLPEVFSQDKQRMGRFSREAQLLASLNHPNIAAIYGLEEIQAPASSPLSLVSGQTPSTQEPTPTRCLVMELVEGEDLSERIARGPVPLDEALSIAVQVSEALENAHDKGIIHRDLKPANIKLTPEGKVKVLDFGLAKALDDPASGLQSPTSAVSQSPTLSMAATQAGIIMGTAAYMSPEQARGKATDRRTDLWAFGCVLYEMLSGTQVFNGSDTSEIMARVITHDPDWSALPPTLPNPILRLLKRCLRKESAMRLPSAAMIRITILDYLDDPDEVLTARAKHRPGWLAMVLLVCAGVLFGVAISVLTRDGGAESSEEVIQVDLILDPPVELTQSPVVSPDGKTIVYTGRAKGTTQLFRRGFAENESTVIPGTEGGVSPFFSPDGRWVSFFAGGRLKKILLEGGQPIPVAVYAGTAVGGAWTRDDRIVFLSGGEGRPQVIPSSGGTVAILSPDQDRDILLKGAPQLLPGGMQMLVTVKSLERPEESHVGLLDSGTGQLKNLAAGSDPKVVAPGLISYLYGGILMIARFDPQQGSLGPGRVAPV
ncbi:MAG: serine/threonine-protein kinase, partial [Acidobacteriota bacterium]